MGVMLTLEEATCLMKAFDRYGTGEMHYMLLTQELMHNDPHFLEDATIAATNAQQAPTRRTPDHVQANISKIKQAADTFAYKSKFGALKARDLLHGTFVRFDVASTGRVTADEFKQLTKELRVHLTPADVADLITWFDSDGTSRLDYNELIRQIYNGQDDVSTKPLVLPRLGRHASGTVSMSTSSLFSPTRAAASDGNESVASFGSFGSLGSSQSLSSVQTQNLKVIESLAVKHLRAQRKRQTVLAERKKIERKLRDVEEQRQKIIDDYQERHPRVNL